jgi:hypothetical protein
MIDLATKKTLPAGVDNYFSLNWMYHDLKGFLKPSPDQLVEEQKSSANRVQIIKKTGKVSNKFKVISSVPVIKPKIETNQKISEIFKEE